MTTSSAVRAALRGYYPTAEYALLFEVGKGTGYSTSSGWADAVAMSLWPSRGLHLHGIEIKVSRSDWLRELKAPGKADEFFSLVDFWWIASPANVVKDGELPPTWGHLLVTEGGKIKIAKQAPMVERKDGDVFSRRFMAALLRRASQVDAGEVSALVAKEVEAAREKRREEIDREVAHRTKDHTELLQKLQRVKAVTGIDLEHWTPTDEIAAAIQFALSSDVTSKYSGMARVAKQARELAERIEAALPAVTKSEAAA